MEGALGRDLGGVRIHTDAPAGRAALDLDARAFTVGQEIAFEPGAYAPQTSAGRLLLAHELAHVVQQGEGGAPAGRVQRQPKPGATSADAIADKIDQHPAWGDWKGGTGSIESYQEIEANMRHAASEASFWTSVEFSRWYLMGWRGVSKLDQPMKALQYLAAVLVTNEKDRRQLLADVTGLTGTSAQVSGGQISAASSRLDAARKSGKEYDAGDFMDDLGLAMALDRGESTGNYDSVEFDTLAKGRKLEAGMGDIQSFERWTVDGLEVSASDIQTIVNQETAAKRQVPQVSKDFVWLGVVSGAGTMKVHSPHLSPTGTIPKVANGAIARRMYELADGRTVRREFWIRIDPGGDFDKGNRMLRLIWSQWMALEGLPASDPSAMMMYGDWSAGRMGGGGGRYVPKGWKPSQAKPTRQPPGEEGEGGGGGGGNRGPKSKTQAPAEPMAILPGGKQVPPDSHSGGYHGSDVPPSVATKTGLPARGNNWDLQNHAEENWHYAPAGQQKNDSAFRGTTSIQSDPVNEGGAAYFTGEGGWVYEIRGVPTWDVNKNLQGRIGSSGNFRGNLMHGEGEYAIPAQVPPGKIVRWGVVKADSRGRLYVDWQSSTTK